MSKLDKRLKEFAEALEATVVVGHAPHGSGHTFARCGDVEVEDTTLEGALSALAAAMLIRADREVLSTTEAHEVASAKADAMRGVSWIRS